MMQEEYEVAKMAELIGVPQQWLFGVLQAACAGYPTGNIHQTPVAAMADDAPAVPMTPLKEAEDRVALILNGGTCTQHNHDALTGVEKLILFKMLKLDMPHQSTNLNDLDAAIRKALK